VWRGEAGWVVSEAELFASVDALLEEGASLPPPGECARLREAAGISQSALARVMRATTQTVKNWENGRSVPRGPRLAAYRRLLQGWAVKYPAPDQGGPAAATASRHRPVPGEREATEPSGSRVGQSPGEETGRRLPRRAVPASSPDPRFPHGPLAVLEGDGVAHGSGGIVLD
jgi:DNA-binding transcriptional regulator YiaG